MNVFLRLSISLPSVLIGSETGLGSPTPNLLTPRTKKTYPVSGRKPETRNEFEVETPPGARRQRVAPSSREKYSTTKESATDLLLCFNEEAEEEEEGEAEVDGGRHVRVTESFVFFVSSGLDGAPGTEWWAGCRVTPLPEAGW